MTERVIWKPRVAISEPTSKGLKYMLLKRSTDYGDRRLMDVDVEVFVYIPGEPSPIRVGTGEYTRGAKKLAQKHFEQYVG